MRARRAGLMVALAAAGAVLAHGCQVGSVDDAIEKSGNDMNDGGPKDGAVDAAAGEGQTFAEFVTALIEDETNEYAEPVAIDFSLPDDEDPDSFAHLFE